jgi:glucokinase
MEFARKFIETSDNEENLRAKGKVGRVSIERLCAGPAVPLIYDFFRTKYPDIERTLDSRDFNQLLSKDIISNGVKDKPDPLCRKVVEKFVEIFAVEAGNFALKTLPYGGLYLIGGVTNGLSHYITTTDTFMNAFHDKGRQRDKMVNIPVFLVNSNIEVGLLGSEEQARRLLAKSLSQQLD